jgi:hypothetical protein
MVKEMNSHTTTIKDEDTWPEQLITILREEAAQGSALLKGGLLRKLDNESRANLTDKTAGTRTLVIDIDGMGLPGWTEARHFTEDDLKQATEAVLMTLPKFLRTASYIVNASASLGIKHGINLHLFFLLDEEIEPKKLKDFLTALNFHTPSIKYQTKLTASGMTLTYTIDRTLADNSRIIYIGTPQITGIADPVPERFAYQEKDSQWVETNEITKYMRSIVVNKDIRQRIAEIRESEGLPSKDAHTFTLNDAEGHRQRVLANPDHVALRRVSEDENYVRFNLGRGDSAAYWVHKRDPRIVHNFKGEQPFLFQQADPDGYKTLLDHCDVKPPSKNIHMVFMDENDNRLQLAEVDINTMRLVKPPNELSAYNMGHAIRSHGQEFPDPIPSCNFVFNPHDDRGVDLDDHFVNQYTTPPLLQREEEIDEQFIGCPYELANTALPNLCPTINKVIYSITGCSMEDYNHLVNWLAFIIQEKDKTGTAWLFHGCQGTGKGIFYEYVIKPILTPSYTRLATQETLDDSFTGWTENKLFIACDEISYGNSRADKSKLQKLKNFITEQEGAVRGMRSIAKSIRSYSNWMFFTNDRDSMPIDDNDRRFNICPRQEVPFNKRYPEYDKGNTLTTDLKAETPSFATFLANFEVDKMAACRPLESRAKIEMVSATRAPMSIINRLITVGDIGPLLPIMEAVPNVGEEVLLQAQHILREVILHMVPSEQGGDAKCFKEHTNLTTQQLFTLYCGLSGSRMTTPEFTRSLKKMSEAARSKQKLRFRSTQAARSTNNRQFMGYRIHWKALNKSDVDDITTLQDSILQDIFGENTGFPEWVTNLLDEGDHLEFDRSGGTRQNF